MNQQPSILDLKPADTPAYMTQAWLDFIHWAIGTPEIIDQFRRDSGNYWQPAKTPIEQMIDDATGADRAFCIEFVKWLNVNIWGPCD